MSADDQGVVAIEKKVIDIMCKQLDKDQFDLSRETSFTKDLNLDSLDRIELAMEFEGEFDMSIPDEEAEALQTIGAAVDYIRNIAQSKNQA